jgi:hypothetical protein
MKRQAEARDAQGWSDVRKVRNVAGPGLLLPAKKADVGSGVLGRPVFRAVANSTFDYDAVATLAETIGGPAPRVERGLRC